MVDLGLQPDIGVDADGYGRLYGYRGPKLSELLPEAKIVDVVDEIEHMQMVNSAGGAWICCTKPANGAMSPTATCRISARSG